MPGTRRKRWVNVTCRCGHSTTLELPRRVDIASRLRCSRCDRRGPHVQFVKGPPKRRQLHLARRGAEARKAASEINRAIDSELNDRVDDLFRSPATQRSDDDR
jgi:hypothetical protein